MPRASHGQPSAADARRFPARSTHFLGHAAARGSRLLALLPALLLALSLAPFLAVGCTTDPPGTPIVDEEDAELPPTPRAMRVVSAFGGTHHRLEIAGGRWYQSLANRMLLLDAGSGAVTADLELAPRGTTGDCVDFVALGDRVIAVLADDQVVEIDWADERLPRIASRYTRRELGILPWRVCVVDGEVLVSGRGGIVRLSEAQPEGLWRGEKDGEPLPPVPPAALLAGRDVGCVAPSRDGLVACVGRRILRAANGEYLGAASDLRALSAEQGGGYAFILQATEGAAVGLMDEAFRERSSQALRGEVRAVRVLDGRFFAVNDFEVATWALVGGPFPPAPEQPQAAAQGAVLGPLLSVPIRGARDVGKVQTNRFAIAGTFGRALYRYAAEDDLPGDTFYAIERLPGRLEACVSDRRRVLAGSREGTWMYLIGEDADLSEREIASPDTAVLEVDASWCKAAVIDEGATVVFRMGERAQTYAPAEGSVVSTLALADGKVWIGHERGIDVIGFDPALREIVAEDRVRAAGPMVALYPNRVGGGVTYVARFGGFGVVRPLDENAPIPATPGALDGSGRSRAKIRVGPEGIER
ncbi:MAG: hypothetical protein ACKOYN_04505 [Planctomycetota bacterium]